ncbi:MAG: MarR family transcriptional regulator [Pseudonocardiales bacterium]
MPTREKDARDLAVVLHDLAWLLPRTVGAQAALVDPLPGSELEVMRLLARRPGLSVNQVAGELGLRANNVSVAVRALEARGVLRRTRDATDGRKVRLEPTAAALAVRDRRELSWGARLTDVLDRLSHGDRTALTAAIASLQHLAVALAHDD